VTEIETAIADNRKSVDDFIAAARAVPAARWAVPRANGAWSPGQIVEHLALTYEFNRKVVAGTAPALPLLLRPILRPLLRRMVITNTLQAGRFTRKGRTPAFLRPGPTPPSVAEAVARLNAALSGLEGDLRSRHPDARHTVDHPAFGSVPTQDWMRVQAIHARHHRDQLTST
jgi:hypothetical protein